MNQNAKAFNPMAMSAPQPPQPFIPTPQMSFNPNNSFGGGQQSFYPNQYQNSYNNFDNQRPMSYNSFTPNDNLGYNPNMGGFNQYNNNYA